MFLLAFLALILERFTGYPDWLFRLIGHPVTWIGRLISQLDTRWNREADDFATRKRMGIQALAVLMAIVILVSAVLQDVLLVIPLGPILLILVAASLPAQKLSLIHI